MAIVRTKKRENPFVQIDKGIFHNSSISWKAKGIMGYLLSKPDDWITYITDVEKQSTDGRDSVRSGINELIESGYMKREEIRNSDGTFGGYEYCVSETPLGLSEFGKSEVGVSDVGEGDTTNNEPTNNEPTNNEYIYSLFDHWNKQNIINHKKINQKAKSHINARLSDYTFKELKKAITNYGEVLASNNHYWTYRWTLQDFMKPNNVEKFLDKSNPKENFKRIDKPKKGAELEDDGRDYGF